MEVQESELAGRRHGGRFVVLSMRLFHPSVPKHTRMKAYLLFSLLLIATMILGVMSLQRSISEFAHVTETASEASHQLSQDVKATFSQ